MQTAIRAIPIVVLKALRFITFLLVRQLGSAKRTFAYSSVTAPDMKAA
jgi:hypothetical protein